MRYRNTHFKLFVGDVYLGVYNLPDTLSKEELSAKIEQFKARQHDVYQEEVNNGRIDTTVS